MTETDDRLIAASAIVGDSRMPIRGYSTTATIGMLSALQAKAKNRLCWMLRSVLGQFARRHDAPSDRMASAVPSAAMESSPNF